jgi:hypothetical protein
MLSNHDVKMELERNENQEEFEEFLFTSFSIRLHTTLAHKITLKMIFFNNKK